MGVTTETRMKVHAKVREHLGPDIRGFSLMEALLFNGNIERNETFLQAALSTLVETGKISLVKRD